MIRWVLALVLSGLFIGRSAKEEKVLWDEKANVYEVLKDLGEPRYKHQMTYTEEQVKKGEAIVKTGRALSPSGRKTTKVSRHYMCTTCHNLVQENPDIRISDPETRLDYAIDKKLPFLQGSTFKGIVNRESWYNDDYVEKYGDEKIELAHENLREAIQLCAIECSQGRPMQRWEIEAVLAYYWSLQWKLGDLGLSAQDYQKLNAGATTEAEKTALREWLKSYYAQTSPAHFYDAPKDKRLGYEGLHGNPQRGKAIYDLSCLHCHKPYGVSHYILDDSKLSFKHLYKMMTKDSHFSIYQIIAYGTYAIPGHRPYMPHYPEERMSKQQVEDLRAYIEQQCDNL